MECVCGRATRSTIMVSVKYCTRLHTQHHPSVGHEKWMTLHGLSEEGEMEPAPALILACLLLKRLLLASVSLSLPVVLFHIPSSGSADMSGTRVCRHAGRQKLKRWAFLHRGVVVAACYQFSLSHLKPPSLCSQGAHKAN